MTYSCRNSHAKHNTITQALNSRNEHHVILRYGHKPTSFGATVNKTDFAVSVTKIQLVDPTPVIKLWLCDRLCTKHSNVLHIALNSIGINYSPARGNVPSIILLGGNVPKNLLTSEHTLHLSWWLSGLNHC